MEHLATLITATIAGGGYLAIIALMALESACIPLPSELIMPFAGYLITTGRFTLAGATLAGAIGCNLGSAAAYSAGLHLGRPFITRYGRSLLITPHDLTTAETFFHRFGPASIFIARLLPVVRTFIALPAGIAHMKLLPFHTYTFAGSILWCGALTYIGEKLGQAWNTNPTLRHTLHTADAALSATLALTIGLVIWRRLRRG